MASVPRALPYLLAVLADVGVDFIEGAQHVELHGVQAGLLSEVGIHVLITDGGELGNVCIVSVMDGVGALVRLGTPPHLALGPPGSTEWPPMVRLGPPRLALGPPEALNALQWLLLLYGLL